MSFPTSPSNDDLHTEFGRTFKYSSATNSWSSATPDAPEDNTPITQGYVDVQSLPLTGVAAGSKAFVQDGNKLFIFTGSGWFEIATINTAPTITSGADATYTTTPDGNTITVTLQATDPEGTPIVWGYQVSNGSLGTSTVTNVDNVFTITPGSTETTFDITFTASDGVNIDTSTGTFNVLIPFVFGGTTNGYSFGGSAVTNKIEIFSLVTDNTKSINPQNLSTGRQYASSGADKIKAHIWAGFNGNPSPRTIESFTFASGSTSASASQLSADRYNSSTGHSDGYYSYIAGGGNSNISRAPFTSDAVSVSAGSLSTPRNNTPAGASSTDYGYVSGGMPQGAGTIEKFSFASTTTGTSVGNNNYAGYARSGQSSSTHGYSSGGYNPSNTLVNNIEKWPFASDTSATDVGNLTSARNYAGSVSSTTHGFAVAGSPTASKTVNKFPFASDANAVTTVSLVENTAPAAGSQI